MPVVTFSLTGRGNCAVVAGVPYVYATVRGRGFVLRAQCPHRGGPLHLAALTDDAARLVCPWHERRTSVARLRAAVPAVRTGDRVTAVLPALPAAHEGPPAPVSLEHRPLSPCLARATRPGGGGRAEA